MRYRKLGGSGIEVSVIGHGTWQMGNDFFGDVDEAGAVKAIHASLDSGVNLIDTAAAYGEDGAAEKVVARAIEGRRNQVVLATKLGVLRFHGQNYVKCLDPNVMRIELELSLKRLKTDYIDLYQIHWPDYNNGIEGALSELVKMREEGKIRAIGVSNFNTGEIKTAIDIAGIASVQPPLNMLNRASLDNGVIPFCAQHNVGVLTYGSLGGGILAGKADALAVGGKELRASFYNYYAEPMLSKCKALLAYLGGVAEAHNATVAEVSINWALGQQGVTSALIGASDPAKAMQNAKAADWELSKDEMDGIEAEYKRIMA